MNKDGDLFCKIYVDADVPRNELVKTINSWLGGTIQMNIVSIKNCELEVKKNEDFNENKRIDNYDNFLFFRYYIDVEALPDQNRETHILLIVSLLENLWAEGFKAVAACDYEEELPKKGKHI